MVKKLLVCGLGIALGGCYQPMKPSDGHLRDQAGPPAATIPPPVQTLPAPPRPKPTAKPETYSVVVNNVPVRELLFALARDAKVNVDINPGITGAVTLNAIDQTLPQLLNRIAKQVDMRYELDGPNLVVMPDSPFLRVYKIDYVNMDRQMTGSVTVSGRIAGSTGGGAGAAGGAGGAGASAPGGAGGASNVAITNTSNNKFWETLKKNIEQLLHDTDKIIPGPTAAAAPAAQPAAPGGQPNQAGGGAGPGTPAAPSVTFREAASVIANPEASVITIRATARQHERVQEFLDQVLVNAKRQVLIEATIVEVLLSNQFQQGIDFNILRTGSAGFSGGIVPQGLLSATPNASFLNLAYTSASFVANLKLLETFGTVRVLSSPRISVVNNQTAVLKVVESVVYFQVSSNATQAQTTTLTTFTTTPLSIDVGIVLNVTPQISDNDAILLNIKPSVTSVTSFVDDPNPSLRNPCGQNITGTCSIAPIPNRVPQVQTREMESVLRLASGQTGVMGGLIQDRLAEDMDSIPGVNRIPIIGDMFSNKVAVNRKVELVIFLRPVVVRDPSLEGDYRGYRVWVPADDFMSQPNPGRRLCDYRIDPGCPR
jgi:MSHA type pilus biogenesis protein MshL